MDQNTVLMIGAAIVVAVLGVSWAAIILVCKRWRRRL